jgi:hypothetical protein
MTQGSNHTPSVGRIVHYVSYGTPNGEYQPEHRAAVITEVLDGDSHGIVNLCVLNPQGIFFTMSHNEEEDKRGGTWHWPERA